MSGAQRSRTRRVGASAQGRPIRIVPLRPPGELYTPAQRAWAPAKAELTYRGGPLLTAVEAFGVFWGAGWNDAAQQAILQGLNGFLEFVVGSAYIGQLAEYGVPKQAIGLGRYVGSTVVIDPAPGITVMDPAIQQMLDQGISNRSLPAPTPNSLYFVFLAPGITVVAGAERSCQVFCGYHDRSASQRYYAVVPYPNCAGCLGGLAALDAMTSVCSHELAEAITDPVPGQGWYDDANGEIGDICAWQNKKLGAYQVQLLWSNRAKSCV